MNTFISPEKLRLLGLVEASIVEVELSGRDAVARGFASSESFEFESAAIERFIEQADALFLLCQPANAADFKLANFEAWPELIRVWAPTEDYRVSSADAQARVW